MQAPKEPSRRAIFFFLSYFTTTLQHRTTPFHLKQFSLSPLPPSLPPSPHATFSVSNSLPQYRNTELQASGLALAQKNKSHLCTGTNFTSRKS